MSNIPKVLVSEFDYRLPDERIAKFPLPNREESKLLVYDKGEILQTVFSKINKFIKNNNLLVFNNTRVVQARLNFKRKTGANIEIFILEPIEPFDYSVSFLSTGSCVWKCIVGNLKRWKEEELELTIPNSEIVLKASKINVISEGVIVKFTWDNNSLNFAQIIERCGEVPIPPYLNRKAEESDKNTYQTVYAKPEGSVAAPTAGLHFTPELLESIKRDGVTTDFVTLHVGAGTFKPVKAESISEHEMHTEHFFINSETISRIKNHNGGIVSVGTTTLRTLESIYWIGVKIKCGICTDNNFSLSQWDPYNLPSNISLQESLESIEKKLYSMGNNHISATTQLCVVPGYKFQVVDTLITNYHQPRSTLLMLVAAFIGDDWKKVYSYALNNNFRFLSYGDSSILFRKKVEK